MDGTTKIERSIIALFAGRNGRSNVEVPYGGSTPAGNTTRRDSDNKEVSEAGIASGTTYTHQDVFNVMPSAPAVSDRDHKSIAPPAQLV